MILVNEECDYIIKNIDAVNALRESYDRTTELFPVWFRNELSRKLGRRVRDLPFHGEIKWQIDEEDDQILITPVNYYDDDKGFGIYYGLENFKWSNLIPAHRDEGLWLYLYYELPEKITRNMRQSIKDWESKLIEITEQITPELLRKYQVTPDENYLVAYYLHEILNMNFFYDKNP